MQDNVMNIKPYLHMRAITIAIADDHVPTLNRLGSYLGKNEAISICLQAVNGYDLILKIANAKTVPEIILLDINMPVIDGVSASFYLNYHFPNIRVIGLSVYDDLNMITNVITTGAAGYVLKANVENVLEEAIRHVHEGYIYFDPRIELDDKQKLAMLAKREKRDPTKENSFGLTPREATFVILNATPLSYDQIARIMFVETKTIQTYFDRVAKKLNVSSRQALTIFSIQNGLSKLANYP